MNGADRLAQFVVLALAAATASYARVALGPLQEALRASLSLSDSNIAMVQGMAMAVPLSLASIPIGLLVDRISRKWILLVSMSLALTSCVLTAVADNLSQLIAARCLTGLSLPGILVAAYSMSGDLYPAARRGRATMMMGLGEVAGAPAAFALGGTLLVAVSSMPAVGGPGWDLVGWRLALLYMGVPMLIVTVAMLCLREPRRTEQQIVKPPIGVVWLQLWRYRAMAIPLQLGRAALFVADGAVYVWGAPLLSRKFHLPPDRTGATLGSVLLVSGLLGPVLGGSLVDFCHRRGGPRRVMMISAGLALSCVPLAFFALTPSFAWTAVLMGTFLTIGFAIATAVFALTLTVIPGEIRGVNIGISIVVGSLFFVGLAPLAVSALSILLGGEEKLGLALGIVCGAASLLNAFVIGSCANNFPHELRSGQGGLATSGARA